MASRTVPVTLLPLLSLLLPFLLRPAVAQMATVIIGEVSQRDRTRPMFEVHFPRKGEFETSVNPSDDQLPAGITTMRVVTARGQAMRCLLPESESLDQRRRSDSTLPDALPPDPHFETIDDILKDHEDKCFLRVEGWWTYEFCYGKHVIQKHVIPNLRDPEEGEVEDLFYLGLFDPEVDRLRRKDPSQVSSTGVPFSQLYINGTECDMTGRPRRVVVKYVCHSDAIQLAGGPSRSRSDLRPSTSTLNIIAGVREVESCVYEIEFMNAAICKHPAYQQLLINSERPIHCSLEHGEGPFEGLKPALFRRASLTL